jgi:3-oxoacyl-[acyl-carrier protein] reductase
VDTLKELKSLYGASARVIGQACDVSNPVQVNALVAMTSEALGDPDILVNNAGIYGPIGPLETVDWAEWVRAMEINLYGALHLCRAVIPGFKRNRRGRIINISGGGATNPMPRFSAYAASKAALVRLTETLAEELRDFGITVNAIAPGALKTRLTGEVLKAGAEAAGREFYERNVKWAQDGATAPELGARLCAHLASSASGNVTGKLISAQWDPWERLQEFETELQTSDIYCLRRIVPKDRGKTWGDR